MKCFACGDELRKDNKCGNYGCAQWMELQDEMINMVELEGEIMYLQEQIEEAQSRKLVAADGNEAADIDGEIMYFEEELAEKRNALKRLRE